MADETKTAIPTGEEVSEETEAEEVVRKRLAEEIEGEDDGDIEDLSLTTDEEFIAHIAICAQDADFDTDMLKRLFILGGRWEVWLSAETIEDEFGDDDDDDDDDDDGDDDDDDEALIDEDPEPDDEL